jgi:hypothetical protein
MKRLIILMFLFCAAMLAQPGPPLQVFYVGTDPTGNCGNAYITVNITTQNITTCKNGTWTTFSGGGGGTVTSIATTGPITGGTITTNGTIACPTCGVTGSPLSQFASTTSAQLAGVISDETGTGLAVFNTSPTLVTPGLGTPTSVTLTNALGLPAGGLAAVGADNILGNFTAGSAIPSTQAIPACANDGAHALVYVAHVLTCESVTAGGDTITSPNGSITVGGTATNTTLDVSLSYLNGFYAQLAAANTFSTGATQTFQPSSTLPGVVLAGGSLPSAMVAGSLCNTNADVFCDFDGTNIHYMPFLLGSGNTAPTTPTSGDLTSWGANFAQVDAGFFASNVVRKDASNVIASGTTDFTAAGLLAATQAATDNSTKAATTAYVTTAVANALAGTNPAVAVLAASTASLTGTYSNGVGGIGATFTVTATGAFTLDGVSISTIGQRVLLKNQSSGFQNGVYTATVVGTVAVSPVFTRALDYDMPSDINTTGAIPVQSGTANATTSWLLTSTVGTVGTDALTYVQFSLAPANLVTAVSPGAGLCHFAGSTQVCTSSAVSLTADVSGILPAANGGTGVNNTATLTMGTSNHNYAALGTGPVKNTTTTGAFSIAVAADIYGLWSGGCSSSNFLRGDGTCVAAGSSAGTYYQTSGYQGTGGVAVGTANHTICTGFVVPPGGLSVGHITFGVGTADGGGGILSDVGIYTLSGTTATLAAHIGAQSLNSVNSQSIAFTGGTQTIAGGPALMCYTTTAVGGALNLWVEQNSVSFYKTADIGATTSSGNLNSSITGVTISSSTISQNTTAPNMVLWP